MRQKFTELDIKTEILKAVTIWDLRQCPQSRQKRSCRTLKGRTGQAQTGTGKTAAFGILFYRVIPVFKKPQAIVLSSYKSWPFRSLMQGFVSLQNICQSVKILPIYGGQEISKQIRSLKVGYAQIINIIGTLTYDGPHEKKDCSLTIFIQLY